MNTILQTLTSFQTVWDNAVTNTEKVIIAGLYLSTVGDEQAMINSNVEFPSEMIRAVARMQSVIRQVRREVA